MVANTHLWQQIGSVSISYGSKYAFVVANRHCEYLLRQQICTEYLLRQQIRTYGSKYAQQSNSLSLSLFRFLPAYLLPFLLFNFSIIQTTLKLVLFTVHLHLHFLFHGSGKFQTVAATVRVTARILPEKRSKYSVVGTKTKKNP